MASTIDLDVLNQLREILGEDFNLILESFFEEGTQMMASMESAMATGNLQQMKEAAHSMKSMSGNVGAMQLSAVSDEMQTASGSADADKVNELWPELKGLYEQAAEELGNIS